MTRLVIALVLLSCGGCVASPALLAEARAGADPAPCRVPVDGATEPWREIRAQYVTFCVPASWRVSATRAEYGAGSIEWQFWVPREAVAFDRVTHSPTDSLRALETPGNTRRNHSTEMIGGHRARLWRDTGAGTLQTRATWASPAFAILGEARGEENVQLLWAVFHTVRFDAP